MKFGQASSHLPSTEDKNQQYTYFERNIIFKQRVYVIFQYTMFQLIGLNNILNPT